MLKNGGGSLGRLHLLPAPGKGRHAAEIATVRTSDARLVDGCPFAEISGQQVLLNGKTVVGIPRKHSGAFQRALRVVNVFASCVFIGKAPDALQAALSAKRTQQLEERIFTLTAHGKIDVRRIQRRLRVIGWEVSSPDSRDVGKACLSSGKVSTTLLV